MPRIFYALRKAKNKKRQGPTLSGRYTEVFVSIEVSVSIGGVRQERADCMIRRPRMQVKSNMGVTL